MPKKQNSYIFTITYNITTFHKIIKIQYGFQCIDL